MKVLSIFFVFFSISFSVFAQNNLDFFIDQAVENSATIVESQNSISIAQLERERLIKSLSGPLVYLTADYLFAPYFNNPQLVDTDPQPQAIGYDAGITNGGLYSALLNVDKPLFTRKLLAANLAPQKTASLNYAYSKKVAVHEVVKNVTDQYIKVYEDQALMELNQELLSIIRNQESIVTQLAKAALMKRSDVLLIALEKKNQQATLSQQHSMWQQDLFDLYILCGIGDSTTIKIERPDLMVAPDTTGESLFLKQYKMDSLAVADSLVLFNTKYLPSFKLTGNAGLNAVSLDNIQRKVGLSAGFSLNLPLYDGHQKDINRQKSDLSLNSLYKKRTLKEKEVKNNLLKYERAITATRERGDFLESQRKDYKSLLAEYQAEINTGQLSVIEYLKGLKLYQQVEIDAINAQTELMRMKNAYNYWNW